MIQSLNLSVPRELTIALGPDLILMGGAMVLLLWAAWRPESARHQSAVAYGSIALALVTMVASGWYLLQGFTAPPGPIAVDNFRWMANVVILIGTVFAIALARDDNNRNGVGIAETGNRAAPIRVVLMGALLHAGDLVAVAAQPRTAVA